MARADQGMTVTSVLMNPGTGRLWVADGNPCTTAYRELDYSGLLAASVPGGPAASDPRAAA